MEEKLRIAGRTRTVAARAAGPGRIRLEVDGAATDVRAIASRHGCHVLELGGSLETVFTARSAEGTWVWHRGRARLVERAAPEGAAGELASPPRRDGDAAATAGAAAARPGLPAGAVTPPMPALVVAVLVEAGQVVARGDPLVVVSAMKTESQLDAPVAGRVKSVTARVGAKVRPGEILAEVEPEGGRHGG